MNQIDVNNKLINLYNKFLIEFIKSFDQNEREELSLPILLHAFPDYFNSKYKILFVGKETYNWYGKISEQEKYNVKFLVGRYQEFEFAKCYHGKNSPFWRLLHAFNKEINLYTSNTGFLWTNFSKTDHNKTTPTKELQKKANKGYHLLKDEIKIIKPDIVIFLTSWKYDNKIREVFKNVEFEIIEPRKLSRIKHHDLPELTFRTYHPTYLQRSKQFDRIINKIVELCK